MPGLSGIDLRAPFWLSQMFRRSSPSQSDLSASHALSQPDPNTPRLSAWWLAVAVFVVTVLAYLPALHGALIWDDDMHVTRAALRSLHGLWLIWSDPHATQQYYPLLHSAFWVEHRLWGDRTIGYHLLNVLLHATNACLLAAVLRRLKLPGAWLAAFIFALHPVCVESVAWISEQKNTLSTAFYLFSALVYLRFDEKRSPGSYALALFLFVLALLTKSVTATLPAALLVIFWWRRGRLSWRRDVLPLLPWFVIGVVSGLFTAWVEKHLIGAEGAAYNLTFLQRSLLAGRVVWFYFGKLIWPADLIFIYPHWEIDPAAVWQWLPPAALLALALALWLGRKRAPGSLAALLFFGGTLFPVLGFFNVFPFLYSYVADHFQYVASFGVITALAAGAATVFARVPPPWKTIGWPLAGLLLAGLGWLTAQQCGVYRDAETVYRTTLARNPACWMALDNLGVILLQQGKPAEAVADFQESLRLKSDNVTALVDFGSALDTMGRKAEAIRQYEKALRLKPTSVAAHRNLGIMLADMNRLPEAISHYRQALRSKPDNAELHEDLGNALLKSGHSAEAIDEFKTALQLDPNYPAACLDLGIALSGTGQADEAIGFYQRALQLKPDYVLAYDNLGVTLAGMGKREEAIGYYQKALQVDPRYAPAHDHLGVLLAQSGRIPEAIAQYREALRLDPGDADVHDNLGLSLARTGKSAEALREFKDAVRLRPDYAKAHHNLGVVLVQLGRIPEAIGEFEQTVRLDPGDAGARDALAQLRKSPQPKN